MTNLEILRSRCTAIASSFYPDRNVLEVALFDAGINPADEATPNDVEMIKVALRLVRGFVETSRGEGRVSVGTDWDAVKTNIIQTAKDAGLDPAEYTELSTITDRSDIW